MLLCHSAISYIILNKLSDIKHYLNYSNENFVKYRETGCTKIKLQNGLLLIYKFMIVSQLIGIHTLIMIKNIILVNDTDI